MSKIQQNERAAQVMESQGYTGEKAALHTKKE